MGSTSELCTATTIEDIEQAIIHDRFAIARIVADALSSEDSSAFGALMIDQHGPITSIMNKKVKHSILALYLYEALTENQRQLSLAKQQIPLLEKYSAHLPEQVDPLWIGYHGYDAYEDSLWDYPGYRDTKPKTPSLSTKSLYLC